jgi:thiosulfate dehydrogenase [quinone] large subunit
MKAQQWSVFALRFVLGWYMVADAYLIVTNPNWSAAGFLASAKTFPAFYAWFAQPQNLVWINPLNEWGIMLIGIALLLGIGVRPAAWAAVVLHILYYFPHYAYPFQMQYGWVVEEHIIYAAAFAVVALSPFAEFFGLGAWARRSFLARIPLVRSLI